VIAGIGIKWRLLYSVFPPAESLIASLYRIISHSLEAAASPQHQTTTGLDSGWFVRLAIHLTRYLNLLWFGVVDLPPLPENDFFEFSDEIIR
jgi:hypothetical protein